jgi:hypothetical protein
LQVGVGSGVRPTIGRLRCLQYSCVS